MFYSLFNINFISFLYNSIISLKFPFFLFGWKLLLQEHPRFCFNYNNLLFSLLTSTILIRFHNEFQFSTKLTKNHNFSFTKLNQFRAWSLQKSYLECYGTLPSKSQNLNTFKLKNSLDLIFPLFTECFPFSFEKSSFFSVPRTRARAHTHTHN